MGAWTEDVQYRLDIENQLMSLVICKLTSGESMTEHKSGDLLEGKTLEMILNRLVDHYGWETLGEKIKIRCFCFDPNIKSSLTFLRKTPWAREKVERLYRRLETVKKSGGTPKK